MFRASLLIFGHQMVSSFGLFLTGEKRCTADNPMGGGLGAFGAFGGMGVHVGAAGGAAGGAPAEPVFAEPVVAEPVFRQKITIECKDKNNKAAKCPLQPSLMCENDNGQTTRKTCMAGKDKVFGLNCEMESETDLVIYETMKCISCADGNSVACPSQLSSKPIGKAESNIPTENTYYFNKFRQVVQAPAENTTDKC